MKKILFFSLLIVSTSMLSACGTGLSFWPENTRTQTSGGKIAKEETVT